MFETKFQNSLKIFWFNTCWGHIYLHNFVNLYSSTSFWERGLIANHTTCSLTCISKSECWAFEEWWQLLESNNRIHAGRDSFLHYVSLRCLYTHSCRKDIENNTITHIIPHTEIFSRIEYSRVGVWSQFLYYINVLNSWGINFTTVFAFTFFALFIPCVHISLYLYTVSKKNVWLCR